MTDKHTTKKIGLTKKMCYSGIFLALCWVLPLLTGQIPQVGKMLSPMHFPVFLCGFVCGWPWGLVVGLIAPVTRSLIFGSPALYPMAAAMAVEMAAYGFLSGLLYRLLPKKPVFLYVTLILSMLGGRAVYGAVMFLLTALSGGSYTLSVFAAAAFINAWPGIVCQLLIIPPAAAILTKAFRKSNAGTTLPTGEKTI